jgi:hypothetical protein
MFQSWSTTQKGAAVTLSNGNLTAASNAASTYAPVYGAISHPASSRIYWEVTVRCGASNGDGVGIGNTSTSAANGQWLGIGTDSIGWYYLGAVFNGGSQVGTWGTFAGDGTPTILCFAADRVSNKLWGRSGVTGLWLNAAIGSQNPAVGSQVGGMTIPSGVLAAPIVPGVNGFDSATPDSFVGAFSEKAWSGTPPAGFSSIDPTFFALPTNAPLRQRTEMIGY